MPAIHSTSFNATKRWKSNWRVFELRLRAESDDYDLISALSRMRGAGNAMESPIPCMMALARKAPGMQNELMCRWGAMNRQLQWINIVKLDCTLLRYLFFSEAQ